jgi:hypothetical protein
LCAFKKDGSSKLVLELFVPKEKREYCLKELVETEAKYVDVLTMLRKNFIKAPHLSIKDSDKAGIFMNINELIDFHQDLYAQVLDYVSKYIHNKTKIKALGTIFLEAKSQFLIYSRYCCDLPKGNWAFIIYFLNRDDCSGKGLDLAGNLRILNFAPPRLCHLAPASEVAESHTLPF